MSGHLAVNLTLCEIQCTVFLICLAELRIPLVVVITVVQTRHSSTHSSSIDKTAGCLFTVSGTSGTKNIIAICYFRLKDWWWVLNYSILSRNILERHSFELCRYTHDARLCNIAICSDGIHTWGQTLCSAGASAESALASSPNGVCLRSLATSQRAPSDLSPWGFRGKEPGFQREISAHLKWNTHKKSKWKIPRHTGEDRKGNW